MWLTKNKILFIGTLFASIAPFVSFVSCVNYEEPINIAKGLATLDDKKVVKYTALGKTYFKYLFEKYDNYQGNDFKKPIIINNKSLLKETIISWKDDFLNYQGKQENSFKSLTDFETIVNKAIKQLDEFYSDAFFKENSLIIDYGGFIGPKVSTKSIDYFLENARVTNLKNISLKQYPDNFSKNEKEIEITYDKVEESSDPHTFSPVIYELKNSDFGISNNEKYKISKYWNTSIKTLKSERTINANSYLNIDLSQYSDGWNKIEIKYNPFTDSVDESYSSIFIKSKNELENLIDKSSKSYSTSVNNDKNALIEFNKVISYFDDYFFQNNVLTIVSVLDWINYFKQGSSRFVDDYDIKISSNNINIKLLKRTFVANQDPGYNAKKEIKFASSKNKEKGIPIEIKLPNTGATLFMPINKSKLLNLEEVKISLSISDLE
ncbi:hypothetical protein [Mycoplasmopsis agassizii]|uniref:Lipoprotein n=1 Tax=Mycoplasmopsis agassizii TaxID=33922 RepID=A0ABX4H5T9_9BACT|nr:hypothetical protein [Mycoplasmopsis agassizii]PAF55246.1 hypothetical protein CJF60_00985 [Mycoplasmopsis agassizii]SMC15665.1 hypothetical protein SAMN02745179_00015 [Mycoplasmopsis agassizii]